MGWVFVAVALIFRMTPCWEPLTMPKERLTLSLFLVNKVICFRISSCIISSWYDFAHCKFFGLASRWKEVKRSGRRRLSRFHRISDIGLECVNKKEDTRTNEAYFRCFSPLTCTTTIPWEYEVHKPGLDIPIAAEIPVVHEDLWLGQASRRLKTWRCLQPNLLIPPLVVQLQNNGD